MFLIPFKIESVWIDRPGRSNFAAAVDRDWIVIHSSTIAVWRSFSFLPHQNALMFDTWKPLNHLLSQSGGLGIGLGWENISLYPIRHFGPLVEIFFKVNSINCDGFWSVLKMISDVLRCSKDFFYVFRCSQYALNCLQMLYRHGCAQDVFRCFQVFTDVVGYFSDVL